MAYTRIVVGTDESPTAAQAQLAAVRLARQTGGDLLIVFGYDPAQTPEGVAGDTLAEAVATAEREGIRARSELIRGEAAASIVAAAERDGADLIVVGGRGMGKPRRLRLGAVAEQVAHDAPCDVLIVRTVGEHSARGRYSTILVGTDGSSTASKAVRRGFELAEAVGASVALMFVGDELDGRIALDEARKGQPGTVDVRTLVTRGDPADKLCEVARSNALDLIVVGNKGMTGMRRFLTPVPTKVAHTAYTDVLIVRTVGRSIEDLAAGEGGVVLVGARKVAAYRDTNGTIHAVSPRCTHLGCSVAWNDTAKTWDCPCHGSRYSYDGEVMQGPAQKDLAR
ncbi:MAG: universal stress protein, partial [Actinomycetota bacterium]|nr:universal stress protein [Actinomycetota bacterium]